MKIDVAMPQTMGSEFSPIETIPMGIVIDAKQFKLMNDGQYAHKIQSIVREMCSNAKDSHTRANKSNVPFELHLPDIDGDEPWFSVTDYGIGISIDDIRNIVSKFGESTKDHSDDEIGGYGRGAKTPFLHASSFTLHSIKDGAMVSAIFVEVGDNGLPDVHITATSQTTEPNKTVFSFETQHDSAGEFQSDVVDILAAYPIKPIVNCGDHITWGDSPFRSELHTHDVVSVYDYGNYGSRDTIKVIHGDLIYNVDTVAAGLSDEIMSFIPTRKTTMVFTAIGDIDLTISREQLAYTAKTNAYITSALTACMVKYIEEFNTNMSKVTTLYEYTMGLGDNNPLDVPVHEYTIDKFEDMIPVPRGNMTRYTPGMLTYDEHRLLLSASTMYVLKDRTSNVAKRLRSAFEINRGIHNIVVVLNTDDGRAIMSKVAEGGLPSSNIGKLSDYVISAPNRITSAPEDELHQYYPFMNNTVGCYPLHNTMDSIRKDDDRVVVFPMRQRRLAGTDTIDDVEGALSVMVSIMESAPDSIRLIGVKTSLYKKIAKGKLPLFTTFEAELDKEWAKFAPSDDMLSTLITLQTINTNIGQYEKIINTMNIVGRSVDRHPVAEILQPTITATNNPVTWEEQHILFLFYVMEFCQYVKYQNDAREEFNTAKITECINKYFPLLDSYGEGAYTISNSDQYIQYVDQMMVVYDTGYFQ